MLTTYVTRNRTELLAILKVRDPDFAAQVQLLDRPEQIQALAGHPTIKISIYYHLLGDLGFSASSIVQSRVTRKMFVLDFATISTDSDGDPTHVAIFGQPCDSKCDDFAPIHIGRVEDFVSTETGASIMVDDLKEMMAKIV